MHWFICKILSPLFTHVLHHLQNWLWLTFVTVLSLITGGWGMLLQQCVFHSFMPLPTFKEEQVEFLIYTVRSHYHWILLKLTTFSVDHNFFLTVLFKLLHVYELLSHKVSLKPLPVLNIRVFNGSKAKLRCCVTRWAAFGYQSAGVYTCNRPRRVDRVVAMAWRAGEQDDCDMLHTFIHIKR